MEFGVTGGGGSGSGDDGMMGIPHITRLYLPTL